jgi:putative signal transducing protein
VDPNDPVVLQTTTNLAEAEILKNALEAEGIKCELEGENQASFTGVLGVRVLVRAWDEERARKVLAEHGHHRGEHHDKHKKG